LAILFQILEDKFDPMDQLIGTEDRKKSGSDEDPPETARANVPADERRDVFPLEEVHGPVRAERVNGLIEDEPGSIRSSALKPTQGLLDFCQDAQDPRRRQSVASRDVAGISPERRGNRIIRLG
jgi:hypothetical protein